MTRKKILSGILLGSMAALTTGCAGTSELLGLKVDIGPGDAFFPKTISGVPGSTIEWTNKDPDPHTVTVDVMSGGPTSPTLNNGDTYKWTIPLNASGKKFYYHCQFHGTAGNGNGFGTGMVGVVLVQ
ncbi:MAG: hypothetical protein JNM34_10140 [Chthonomonadaceae bacterium]|nr:hypothetical protein [Chthonomonadaceae bacterium]